MRTCSRAVCAALLALAYLAPVPAVAQTPVAAPPETTMSAGILIDLQSNRVLWAKNPDSPRAPASLAKILTALTVLQNANLGDTTVISPAARNVGGGRMYAEQGWQFTVEDLLWGLLLQSGNDAAVALAEKVSPDGTVAGFMKLANATAAALGAKNSNFVNPHGLDEPGQTTTARDLAIITSAAMRNPVFAQMVSSKTRNVPWGDGLPHTFINHNKMLWKTPGAIGVKTGFTKGAGNSLVSAVRRNGSTLVAVVMGTPRHYQESNALYDWGFENLASLKAQSSAALVGDAGSVQQLVYPANNSLQVSGNSSPGAGKLLIPALAVAMLVSLAIALRQRLLLERP